MGSNLPEVIDDARLAELAAIANEEDRLAESSAVGVIAHSIRCGEALIQARSSVPAGQWEKWCETNLDITPYLINVYTKIAVNKELALASDAPSRHALMTQLAAMKAPGVVAIGRGSGQKPTFDVNLARSLRAEGLTYKQIAPLVGVSTSAVRLQFQTPEQHARTLERMKRDARNRTAARLARVQQQREDDIRKRGGTPSEAYSLLRKLSQVVDRAIADGYDPRLREAAALLVKVEKLIGDVAVGRPAR